MNCVEREAAPVFDSPLFFVNLRVFFCFSILRRDKIKTNNSARRNEFMPGTKHRLVTLAGPPLAVNMARFLIMRKIQTEKEKL